jgi:hypothetical protein
MTRPARRLILPGLALLLAACSIPGASRTEALSREAVTVAGQSCSFVTSNIETNTINGIHRYLETVLQCPRQSFDCNGADRDACVAAIGARP